MSIKLIFAFTILAVVVALAGTVPGQIAAGHVILTVPAVVSGTALQPGVYRVIVTPNRVTFVPEAGRQGLDVPAKVETGERKFDQNRVQYEGQGAQTTISEICLGGTRIRLIFN
jgi:hypothetical protein